MAKPIATREAVFAAADQLLAEGKDPSTLAVQRLVGGSNTTVQKHWKEWEATRSKQAQVIATLPNELASQGRALLLELWESANRIANADIQGIKERADQAISLAEQRLNEALQEIDRLQSDNEEKDLLIESHVDAHRELELKAARQESAALRAIELEERLSQVQAELNATQQQLAYWKGQAEFATSLVATFQKGEVDSELSGGKMQS